MKKGIQPAFARILSPRSGNRQPKERVAMKFLRRYLDEKEPTLKNFAKVVRSLEGRSEGSLPE